MQKYQSGLHITIFLLIISVIIYLNIIFQEHLKKDISLQFNRQQLLLARSASLSIERQVDHYVKYLKTVSRFPDISDIEKNFIKEQVLNTLLADMPQNDPTIIDFQILDASGIVKLDSQAPALLGQDLSGRGYFQRTRQLLSGEVYVSQMLHIEELNPAKRYIVFATPLYLKKGSETGRFNGVALFAISVDDIAGACVSQIRLGDKGYGWVMDSRGTLVYHPDQPNMIGKNLLKADTSCFSCHNSFDAERKILEGAPLEYGMYTAPLGEDKLISYSRAKVGQESWLVCVTVPYTEVTGLIAKSMRLYSVLISIIFLTVIGTSVFFIVMIKKQTVADEKARYTAELEDRILERTSELTREKEKLGAILSGLGAGVSLLDRDHRVLWANEVITQRIDSPVGRKCHEAYRNIPTPCEGCPLPAALAGGRIEQTEMICRKGGLRNTDGSCGRGDMLGSLSTESVGYFQIVISPIRDSEGHADTAVELMQDITAIRMLEQQMMHSEKLAALGRLSAGVAHEIGNPLTAVSSYIQILQDQDNDEFTKGALDIIAFHINRITGILRQMSGISRNYQTEKESVDINEAVKASLDLMVYEKGMMRCEMEATYHPVPLLVHADEKWLVSVFVNLLINALDAMTDTDCRLVIRVVEEVKPGGARIAVVDITDNGIGIATEDLGRIFDPFYTTKQTGKGTGLGLAVSYNIIKELRGEIVVTSHPGEGATFSVKIPVAE